MKLDDIVISKGIIDNYYKKLTDALELDVALVGGGPSNLVIGTILGRNGIKAALFESKLAPGGGMWGGGMMFNEIVVQESALGLLKDMGINYKFYEQGYYTADSVEATSTLISNCVKAGTNIFNLVKMEDVMFRETSDNDGKRISGLVLNWTPVVHMNLHVDPLTIRSQFVVDGTGHHSEVCAIVARKMDAKLNTPTIGNAIEVYPGLYVTGMAANAVMGAPRMGPVFGGMLLSGQKVAGELIKRIGK